MRRIKLMDDGPHPRNLFYRPSVHDRPRHPRDRVDIRGAVTRISRLEDLYYKDILGSISIEGIKKRIRNTI